LISPKTKDFAEIVNVFDIQNTKSMFVFSKADRNALLASRNLKKVKILNASDLNTYDILNAGKIFLSESSIKEIEKMFDNTTVVEKDES